MQARRWPDWVWLNPVTMSLGVMLLVLSLPVTLPYVAFSQSRFLARRRKAASAVRCGRCGGIIGTAGLDRADEAWGEHVAALYRDNPGSRFRLARKVWAICTACDAQYGYDPKTGHFPPILDGLELR